MALTISLGGRVVHCAVEELRNLASLGYPPPPLFERANSLSNTRGASPARGWFLLLRQDLDALDLNALQTLVMTDDGGNAISVPGLVIAREPTCITPSGSTTDPLACYLVEVADARYRCHNPYYSIPLNKQYNVRAPGWGGLYYSASLNSGSAWTWATMLADIWATLAPLGSWPGLPAGLTTDGQPEGYSYLGVSAWQALCQVLDKLGCEVVWQATAGTYTIVQSGAADAASDAILSRASGRLIFDRQYETVVRGRVPAKVRVHFHRVQEHRGSEPETAQDSSQFVGASVYTVDVAGSAGVVSGADANSLHPLWDDLPALYDPAGTLLNAAALATRAANRASAYYSSLQGLGGGRLHQVYSGIVSLSPGSTLSAVVWRQDQGSFSDPGGHGGGLLTEVMRVPAMNVRVADNGQMEEVPEESTALHPPDYRVKEPTYPDLLQTIRVTSTSTTGGAYPGKVECYNADTASWIDRETCWLLPANSETLAASRYLARLVGYMSGAPLYVCQSTATTTTIGDYTFIANILWDLVTFTWTIDATGSGVPVTGGLGKEYETQGILVLNVPLEICGVQFWCCATAPVWDDTTYPSGFVNDWSMTAAATVYRISTNSAESFITLTGIAPFNSGGTIYPQMIALVNVGTEDIILTHQDSHSAANNRFTLPDDKPKLTLHPDEAVILWWDRCQKVATETGSWRVLARGQAMVTALNTLTESVTIAQGNNITVTTDPVTNTITISSTATTGITGGKGTLGADATGLDNTWQDILSISGLTAGKKFKCWAQVTGWLQVSSSAPMGPVVLAARLWDTAAGIQIGETAVVVTCAVPDQRYQTTFIGTQYTPAGTTSLKLQASISVNYSALDMAAEIKAGSPGGTVIGWEQLTQP